MEYLLVDWDEAVVQYHAPFRERMMERLGRPICPNGPSDYSMTDWLGVQTRDEVAELIREFNSNACGTFENLPPKPGSQEAVQQLMSQGHRVIVISSCGDDPKTVAAREKNVTSLLGTGVEAIHCVASNQGKRDLLHQYPPSPWVEDHPENAKLGLQFGHRPFLMRSSHNHDAVVTPSVTRVNDWHELFPLLDAELNANKASFAFQNQDI